MSFPGGGFGAKDNAVGATPHARDTVCRGDVRWSRCVWRQQRRQRQQQWQQRQRRGLEGGSGERLEVRARQRPEGHRRRRSSSAHHHEAARHGLHGHHRTWRKAYFDCVNDNGGINGQPIQYLVETEQTNPQQVASLATKLIESDKVLGIVGNTSLIDCAVNQRTTRRSDFNVIVAGVAPRVLRHAEHPRREHGPVLQLVGAAQYLIRQGAKSLVAATVQGARRGLHQRGRPSSSPSRTASPARASWRTCRSRTRGRRAQAGAGGRRRRRRGAQLHAAGGAEDPAGRRAAGPASTRSSGPARRRATTRRSPRRSGRRGTASSASTRS